MIMDDNGYYPEFPEKKTKVSIRVGSDSKGPLTTAGKIVYSILAVLAALSAMGLAIALILDTQLNNNLWWAVIGAVAAAFSAAGQLKNSL